MKLHLPLSLLKNVLSCLLTAFFITNAAGAIEYLQDNAGLQGDYQSREPLTLVNGQQMTLNGNSVDSSLNLSDGTLSLDYGSATAPSSMQGNDLTLSGGTTLHLIPGTTTDGKYINLLTNVGTLYGADGSQLIFSSANNAASQYFDTSQPGSGYWKKATLQLTSDGTLQMQLHKGMVNDALTITARQTGSVNYYHYESIRFEDIVHSASSEASGGAIYGGDDSTITLSANGSVTFSGNTSTFSGDEAYGGAIYGDEITLSNNGSVTFSGNTDSGGYDASGGAIYGDYDVTLSNNGSVTFDGNTASGDEAYGGAIYGDYDVTLSNNGSVTFSGNTASGDRYAYSGAIDGVTITLSDNGSVTFDGNTASGEDYTFGGAIDGGTITLSNNGSVTFSGNKATSGSSTAYGGAIGGSDDITLSDNGSVTFSGNSASGDEASGGAILASGNLSIRNNDSVLFEKNAEISNGSYRLRSIYAGGSGDVVSLSAAKGKIIEFRDSVYIASGSTVKFNEDYTDAAGVVHKQEGDIIFTGATTVDDLYEVKGDMAGTEEEILLSRTTEVQAMTNLYGGRLRVENGAIYQGCGITVMAGSGATVRVQDAELKHGGYDLTFNSDTILKLVGDSTLLCSTLMMEEGSTLLLDASSAIGTCYLTGNLTMNGSMQLLLGETTAAMENAVLMWVSGEVSGWTDSSLTLNGSAEDVLITWVNNHLVLNYDASTYNQYFNGSIAYSERQFAPLFYHHYEEISFKDIAYSITISSSAYGGAIYGGDDSTITLSANGSVTFSGNTASGRYVYGGAIYIGESSSITLSANESVTFDGNKATTASGGAYAYSGAIYIGESSSNTLSDNGSVTFDGNTASGGSYAYGGAIYGGDDSTITLSNNGSVTFDGNTASGGSYAHGGAIYGGDVSTITLSANGSVTFNGNSASGYYNAYGGAIYGDTITLSDNESVTFSGNKATASGDDAYGGAIYIGESSSITLSDNGSVTFDGNTASGEDYAYGGAIYGDTITLSNNESVTFSGNKATTASGYYNAYGGAIYGDDDITLSGNESVIFSGNSTSGEDYAYGGAIYGDDDITLSGNESVTFDGNTASGGSYAYGGAIYGGDDSTITLSNNGSVTFSENSASGEDYAYGGAIYIGESSSITLSNNGSVTFDGNTASGDVAYGGAIDGDDDITLSGNESVIFSGNSASGYYYAYGGAIDGDTITLSDNESVTFSGNSVESSRYNAYGGAIYGGDFMLSNNGSVTFSGNTSTASGENYAEGGAIRAYGNLSIRNNDSVLFEKNAEISNGSYRLRSIDAGGSGDVVSLSAAKGKSIEFRDSVYIASGSTVKFNEDYTDAAGVVHKQEGDIIFTGAATVDDLYEVKGDVAGTEEEILLSRTTEVQAMTNLYGGRLRVEDGAIYQGCGITAMAGSGATVRVQDAELKHGGYDLTFNSGTKLELVGDYSLLCSTLMMEEGSTLLLDASSAIGTCALTGNLTMNGSMQMLLGETTAAMENAVLMWVDGEVGGWTDSSLTLNGSTGDAHITWVNNHLVLNYNASTYNQYFNGSIAYLERQFAPLFYHHYEEISFKDIAYSTSSSSAYGGAIYGGDDSTITLSANGSVTFSGNSASGDDAYGGAINGGTITLSANGSVTFSGNKATTSSSSSAYGGAIYGYGDITLSNNGSVTFDGNTASGDDASGGAIYGDDDITLSGNESVIFSGNTSTFSDGYAYSGAIDGGGDIMLSDNGSVTFSGNSASGSSASGGAIDGNGDITLSDNGSVTFSGNTASGTSTAYGGAIRAYGNLNIRNNDSVLFEKNAEISNGSYRLRSIYAEGDVVSLSAAKEKSIEFRDSVYIASGSTVKFNADYTDAAGLVHKQEGDIIFTGAYTEKHLNELLTAAEPGRTATAAEIENSRLTLVDAETRLYGGRLRVEDGAIYQGRGITAMAGSGATVRVQDAELKHSGYDLTFNSDTSLELVGDYSLLCSSLLMEEGSTLLLDASSAIGTCALTGNLTMNGSMQLRLGETTAAMENAVLMRVDGEVSGWTDSSLTLNGSTGDAHITWVNNHLVLNYNASTYNQDFYGSIAYSERQFAPLFYHHYEEISFKDIAYSTSSSSAYGGAIYGGYDSTITLSDNGSVTFSGNKATTSSSSSAYGGAIYGDTITLSANGSVTFSGNSASGDEASGGAISIGHSSSITLSANGSVTFSGNTATASGDDASGGAIYGYGNSTITLSDNGSVTFSGNTSTASGAYHAYGGAIYGGNYSTITLSDNGSVTFSGNTASGTSTASGGAIRAYGNLSIRNNDSVLFEKNAEISNGSYQLLSIYAGDSGGVVSLSAAKGKSIEFRDSVYITSGSTVKLNEDYTDAAGLVHKQEGDIIFTGAYTEQHLNELLTAAEAGRTATAAEIKNSRLTLVKANTLLYGGRLRVEDGAVYQGRGITAMKDSGATVCVQDADLKHGGYDLTFNSGTTLELCGKSILSGELNLQSGSTLRLLDGSTSHSGNLSVYGGVEINLSGIEFSSGSNRLMILQTDDASITWAPTYTLVRVANFAQTGNEGYVSYGALEWESGKLYVDEAITNTATWNNATGNGLWDGKSENWVYEGNRLVDIQGIEHVILGETAQGNIRLEGEISVGNIQVKDGCAYILNPAEGAGLQLTGTLSLESSSSLSVNGDLMAAAVSGEGALFVRDSLLVSEAVQAESLHVDTLIAGSLQAGSLQASSLTLTDADATNTIGNSVAMSGDITSAGSLRVDGAMSANAIDVKGALTAGSLQADSLQASSLTLTDADATNTIGNSVAMSGAVDVAGELEINGDLTAGSLQVGSLQASSLTLTDADATNTIGNSVAMSGDITSAGSLRVDGAMSANAIDVKGALTASSLQAGSLQASSLTLTDADATNTIGNSVAMSGAVDVAGELEINGTLTAGSLLAGSLQASSLTLTDADATNTIGNSVAMSGDITSAGSLRVDGAMSANAIDVNDALTAGSLQAGSLQASSLTLTDANATNTIGHSVAMSGAVDVAGELEINGTLTAGSLKAGSLQASSLTLKDADATNTIGNSVDMSGDITSAGNLRVDGAMSANAIDVNGTLTSGSLQAGSLQASSLTLTDADATNTIGNSVAMSGDITSAGSLRVDGAVDVAGSLQASSLTLAQAGADSTVDGDMNVGSLELASGAALTVGGTLTAGEVNIRGMAKLLQVQVGAFGASTMNFDLDRAALESLGLGYGEKATIAQSGTALAPGFVATLNDGQEPVTAAAYNYSIDVNINNNNVYLTADYAYDGLRTWYRGDWVGDSSWTDFYIGGFDAVDGVEVVDLNGTIVEGAYLDIAYEDGVSASIVKNGTLKFECVYMGGGQFELGEATEMIITDELIGKGETLVVHENASLDTPKLTLGTLVMDGGEVTLKDAAINAMSGTEGTLNIDEGGEVTVGSDVTLTGLNNKGTLDLGTHALVVNALVDVGGNVAAGEVMVQSRGPRKAVFDTLKADKVTVTNVIPTGNYTDGISVGDGSAIGELVAETLEVRGGEVTLGRTSGSTEMSLLDLDLQEDATLVLNQQTRLTVTNELTATEDATVKLHGGAGISYLELSVANRNAAKATIVKAVELAEGEFSVLENAYVGVNSSKDSTINYQLIDSSVENLGSGTLYITHENNTLSELVAGGGNITVYNQAELNLESLKVAASMTVSAYCGSTENAANEAKINVTEKASFGAGTTLNADLVIRQGATLEMDGPVNMGSDLYLYSGTLLGENLLTAIRTAEVGTKVDLFAGIDSLYFNGVRQDFSLTLSDGVSAGDYFSNLTDEWARAYYLVYDNSIVNEGLLSIEIVGLSVPEPTTATLSLLALAALAARRRRSQEK